jgi:DNA repair protein RecO (recombination protein O)
MIHKTEAIVLRTQVFQESSLIVGLYTRELGSRSCLVKGVRTAKGSKKHALFQVGNVLNVVLYEKPGRSLQHISESEFALHLVQTSHQPQRMVYAMLACEVFAQAIRQEEPDPRVYSLLRNYLQQTNLIQQGYFAALGHLLVQLLNQCGICPQLELPEQLPDPLPALEFDAQMGCVQVANFGVTDTTAVLLTYLIRLQRDSLPSIQASPTERKKFLKDVFRFMELHLPEFRSPRSLEVFEAVFS